MQATYLFLAAVTNAPPDTGAFAQVGALLSRFGVNWPSFIAAVVNFALVAIVLYWFAFRPLLKTLDERNARIADGLRFSDEMKAKLADAEKLYAERLNAAAAEAADLAREAVARAKIFEERAAQEAIAKANDILRRADAQLAHDREQMRAELRTEVARLVVEITGKVLSKELSADERARFTAAATTEITN
ncbi:MAG: F0F1 ATP synthase subunit B [Puniceicoccales bacterium]|jgi:F-type H+-transporting ATPase subunit b|nr:F0F1 ATP synthase subunit B [Puniceicoccales bacterium]